MMTPLNVWVPIILFLVFTSPWSAHGFSGQGNLESSGLEEQLDAYPDPAGGFCQRNKNPAGLGFIGVKYDILKGNPEGKTSLGGVDPGLEVTRKILKLTNENGDAVPDQICYEARQSCSTAKSSKIFSGTKRYQDKLNVDVSVSAGYSGLFDFSFSLSSKYEKIKKSTRNGETVFRDCTEICNKGEARYKLGSVESNQWTLTNEFASDVCGLPGKYRRGDEYYQFLNTWGTHVVVKVILGTKTITRFRSSLKEFMTYASENVGNSVSVSGGYGGATGSVSVDVSKFEESEETKRDFGEEQLTYRIGGDDLPEPIKLELMGIEETLRLKFWSNLEELKKKAPCKRITEAKLVKFKKNMERAIKEYPGRKKVKRATDNAMELKLSWPSGYYTLFTAQNDGNNVCPRGTGFQWQKGSVTNRNREFIKQSTNRQLIGIKAAPDGDWELGIKYGFCSKIQEPGRKYFSQKWPRGKYCILRKSTDPGQGKCPDGFEVAYVKWSDGYAIGPSNRAPLKEGTYPDGDYTSENYMEITYCCRRDGFIANGINLPIENPFILMNIKGFACQKVCGAQETPVALGSLPISPIGDSSEIRGNIKPAGMTDDKVVELRFCHYQKMDDGNENFIGDTDALFVTSEISGKLVREVDKQKYPKFIKLELVTKARKARTAERECVSRGGHLVSIHSQAENDRVKEMMGGHSRVWIGLKRRTVQNRPWIWWDETELDFGEWKPDVTDDQNYVSMKAGGSWEAKTNDEKLPFVCKVINNCPLSE